MKHARLSIYDGSSADPFTWLPYSDFLKIFECLDDYRLGRQMFEAGVVLDHLVGRAKDTMWKRHASTRMWHGYHSALGFYTSMAVREMHVRGYATMRVAPYDFYHDYTTATLHYAAHEFVPLNEIEYPPWLGDERLHSSHRAGLLALEPKFYAQHGWTEDPKTEVLYPEGINDGYVDSYSKPRQIDALVTINAQMDTK